MLAIFVSCLTWIPVIISTTRTDSDLKHFEALCLINDGAFPCYNALFSPFNYSVDGKLQISESLQYFCRIDTNFEAVSYSQPRIGIALRGKCSFEQKVVVAMESAFNALLIVNDNDDIFPVGASNEAFISKIPVVMIGSSAMSVINQCGVDKTFAARIIFGTFYGILQKMW